MKRALSRKNLWDSLPRPLRAAAGLILTRVPPEYPLGRRFREMLRFLRSAERWPAETARAYQLEQLRRICSLAHGRSLFYRRMFRSAGFEPADLKSPDDLSGLPPIDKETLRAHGTEMLTVPPDSPGLDYVATGGSGGVPLHFYIGQDRSAVEYAHLVRSWERAGYRLATPQAVFRGKVVPPSRGGLRHEYDPLLRRHYYSNFHMSDADMARYLDHIRTLGPCFLHVYPSSVTVLARYLDRTGACAPENIQGILAGSENVYPADRALVERVFGRRLFSWYGHSEKLVLGAECPHSTDYHLWPTYGYFELLDENGHPVRTAGERGEIVGTGFINSAMPFIRYRTGDYATYVDDHCSACGRDHVLIREVLGHRTQEMLVAEDGGLVSWTALNMHDDTFSNIHRFQFRQEAPGAAVLRVVPAGDFGSEDVRRLERQLRLKLEGRIRFSVEIVDRIPLTGRGKATYVDQRIGNAARAQPESVSVTSA